MDYSAFHWSEKARKYAETIGTIFNVKGRVNTIADLPSTGNKVGDLWLVGLTTDTDLIEYAWLSFDGITRWEKLGSTAASLAFSAITGSPNDNVALKNALDGKYSTSNPNGYISGITSAMVTTALGYTPYNSSNPAGYTSNEGTVTKVNNTSPDSSGNVTITIPDPLPSQTGQNGKYLTTNGTSASWGTIPSDSTKANTSLNNLDSTGKSLISGLGMPSTRYEDLTLLASGSTYTAPANGYVLVARNQLANGLSWCVLSVLKEGETTDTTEHQEYRNGSSGSVAGEAIECFLPVEKGRVFAVSYGSANAETRMFRFIYAEGEENV